MMSMTSIRKIPDRFIGVILLVVGASLISFSAVFVKLAEVGPTIAGFYRLLFGGFILVTIVLLRGNELWKGFRPFLTAGVCGLFLALDTTLWHRSIHSVGPGLATILANFQVFFLAGFGVLVLRERLTWRLMVSIPLSVIGLLMLVGIEWNHLEKNYKTGLFLGLSAALFYAAYILTLRRSQSGADSLAAMVNMAMISLIAAGLLGLEGWGEQEGFFIPDFKSWTTLIAYGLVGQVLGWVLISKGLPRVEAWRAGLILLLQPALAFVWDILFFARPTRPIEGLGAFLTLSAIYLGATIRPA